MFTPLPRQGTHPATAARKAGLRLRRLIAVLAAATCGLLASAAIGPAAFAMRTPPQGQNETTRLAPLPATTARVVTAGGMPGWQITLIALAAALLAATATMLLNRALAARRAGPAAAT